MFSVKRRERAGSLLLEMGLNFKMNDQRQLNKVGFQPEQEPYSSLPTPGQDPSLGL